MIVWLAEVMKQRSDQIFIDLLNKVRLGMTSDHNETFLKSRITDEASTAYHGEAMHI